MPPRKRTKKEVEVEDEPAPLPATETNGSAEVVEAKAPKEKKVRKTKSSEPEEPLRMRNVATRMLVGAHVSMAKTIANSVTNAEFIGANAFAMFLKNQRKWVSPDLKSEDIEDFKTRMQKLNYDGLRHVLPHGSYLINLAQDDAARQQQAYECFLDDLKRCEALGIGRYNFHPGSTASCSREKGIENVAKSINRAISETNSVKIVVENMAGHGNIIGGPLEELAQIIDLVVDKSRESYDALIKRFDDIVGLKYLAGMHLNDSKADLGANKDLHQNIGLGYLGLEPFRCIMNDARLEGLPLILETPSEDENGKEDKKIWAREIDLLEWLIDRKADDPEVLQKAVELQAQGSKDREKALEAAQRKSIKEVKAAAKKSKKVDKAVDSDVESD